MPDRSVTVVGAGIAGLSAAYDLVRAGWDVTVLEGSARVGGKLAATSLPGVDLDVGVESLLARRPEALQLITDLGLAEEVVHPTPAQPQVWVEGAVRRLPPSQLGVPVDLDALAEILSPAGLERARQEPSRPAPPLAADVAVGAYVEQRFGAEVVDRLLEPLLGGVYAGRSRELSFAAVNPALWARARTGGSLLAHAQSLVPPRPAAPAPVFAGLPGGVHRLVRALVAAIERGGGQVRTGTPVTSLPAGPLVLAVPAAAATRLLAGVAPTAATALDAVPYASTAVVALVVRGSALTGSGLLVPPGQLPTVKALTYSANKWPWVAAQVRAAYDDDVTVVRASIGRYGEAELLQLDDDALVARTWDELAALPGWPGAERVAAEVTRWDGALPQYLVGHLDRVAVIERAVAAVPGLALCGAYLHGVGVPACIGSGRSAASKIIGENGSRD